jgi:hypothetical protein
VLALISVQSCCQATLARFFDNFNEVLRGVARHRLLLTADRWFADVDLLDVLDELGVRYVIRTKSNYKVRIGEAWRRLDSLSWRGNQRRRAWGRVWYAETNPRRVFLAQSRARVTRKGDGASGTCSRIGPCRLMGWRRSTPAASRAKKASAMANACSVLCELASPASRRGRACSCWWRSRSRC